MRDWARANSFALRLAAFYVVVFLIIGCYMPFLPVWLRSRGLSDWQIAFIYAMPVIMRPLFTPAMSFAADHSGRPVVFLKVLAWGSLASCLALPFAAGFPAIFAAFFLFTLFWMSIVPLTEAVALKGARNGNGEYGRIRLWGSISFVVMTLAGGGAVGLWGPPAALWLFIGAAASVVVVAHWLPDGGAGDREAAAAAPHRIKAADFLQLVRSADLWLFFAATSAVQSAHSVYYIFGTLHWESAGISPMTIGMLWATGVVAEIALFAYAGHVTRHIGAVQLILLGGVAAVLRWTLTAIDPPLTALFPLQMLHGLTYGAAHIGAMQFMRAAVPERLAMSMQGLYASVTAGIVMGLVSLATGPLYRSLDGYAYFVMAGLGGIGVAASLMLLRRWRGGSLVF